MSSNHGHRLQKVKAILHIRQSIQQDVFDYTQLMDALKEYSKPRDIVSSLIRKGYIIRVRKGLYFFGPVWQKQPVSHEMLANLIYGPSAISLEYALAWYGLIPERVDMFTSITTGRSRFFDTPAGQFSYVHVSEKRFAFGITLQTASQMNWVITEPLKALADKVWTDKRFQPVSQASYADYLFEDLRIDKSVLEKYFSKGNVKELKKAYSSRKISWMVEFLLKNLGE
jgi:predicted transcriptional regulator of viral defense system